jgi:hypothetical protein
MYGSSPSFYNPLKCCLAKINVVNGESAATASAEVLCPLLLLSLYRPASLAVYEGRLQHCLSCIALHIAQQCTRTRPPPPHPYAETSQNISAELLYKDESTGTTSSSIRPRSPLAWRSLGLLGFLYHEASLGKRLCMVQYKIFLTKGSNIRHLFVCRNQA